MKSITTLLATVRRWAVVALVCGAMIALIWQGSDYGSTIAIAATNAGEQIQQDNKNFVQDAAEKVKETAKKNANRVEQATGNDSGFVERKAQKDAARIQKRANEDADRTQKAIDNNVNAIERTIDNIKDAFSN